MDVRYAVLRERLWQLNSHNVVACFCAADSFGGLQSAGGYAILYWVQILSTERQR